MPGRECALKGDGAVCLVAGDCGSGAVAGLFGDNGTFVANPFAVVLESDMLERFGENRGTLVLDIVGDRKGCGGEMRAVFCRLGMRWFASFEMCGDGAWSRDKTRDVADGRASFFQKL